MHDRTGNEDLRAIAGKQRESGEECAKNDRIWRMKLVQLNPSETSQEIKWNSCLFQKYFQLTKNVNTNWGCLQTETLKIKKVKITKVHEKVTEQNRKYTRNRV